MNILSFFRPKTRAEQNEKRYRKWLKQYVPKHASQKIELKTVWTDRDGNNYYIANNISHITKERSIEIEKSMMMLSYGISKDEIIERLKHIQDELKSMAWNNPTPAKLRPFVESNLNYIGDFMYRMKNVVLDDLLIQAGLYFFYIDGENPYQIDYEVQQRKFDNIKSDPELRGFFLKTMELILQDWKNTR
jgi:hypothetical protein